MSGGPGNAGRPLVFAAVGVVLASVVAALLVMDPPSRQRAERLDQLRTGHLQLLSQRIDDHALVHDRLPERLAVVATGPGPDVVDPETGQPYEYEVTGERSYRLCATFATESEALEPMGPDAWRHAAGRHCFDRQARDAGATGAAPRAQ